MLFMDGIWDCNNHHFNHHHQGNSEEHIMSSERSVCHFPVRIKCHCTISPARRPPDLPMIDSRLLVEYCACIMWHWHHLLVLLCISDLWPQLKQFFSSSIPKLPFFMIITNTIIIMCVSYREWMACQYTRSAPQGSLSCSSSQDFYKSFPEPNSLPPVLAHCTTTRQCPSSFGVARFFSGGSNLCSHLV